VAIVIHYVGFVLGDTLLERAMFIADLCKKKIIYLIMYTYPTKDRRILIPGNAMTEKGFEEDLSL